MKLSLRRLVVLSAATIILGVPSLAAPPGFSIDTPVIGSGSIVLDPNKPTYNRNNIVNVTAVPESGYRFDHWEGDLAGDLNPTTIRVSGDHSIVAVFVEEGGSGGSGGGGGGEDPPTGNRPPIPESGLIVGYFVQWGIYRRDYVPADIVGSGTAESLDVINYAFAGIDENLQCASLDEFADFEKRFDADETVDGVADTVAQPLKGNFNQLRKLKQRYPRIRVLLSVGGWTESARFSDAALPENREAFVASCIDKFIRGNVAPGVSAAGVFDGLDIDWEYPGRCGATCNFRPEDDVNFTALLKEFRDQLDAAETEIFNATGVESDLLLTIAAPASADNSEPIEISKIHPYLDWINLMTYDFHGGWESSGPTNHHAHLRKSSCDADDATWGARAVDIYLTGDDASLGGVPANKLLIGVPFYGRGWRGVPAVNDGLCQEARGVPRGTYEKGVEDYSVLAAAGKPSFHDEAAAAHWTFDGQEFWTFDDPQSLGWKVEFIRSEGLRGTMFWEMSGDSDTGDLIRALRNSFDQPLP
jgi:chitinase